MTRKQFLKIKFPCIAYCEYKRGPSTRFNESFHITSNPANINVNIYWRCDGKVSIGLFHSQEKNKFKQYETVLDNEKISMSALSKMIKEQFSRT